MLGIMSEESLFASLFIQTDVTSVKIHDNYVFCGIGDTLHIFNLDTQSLLKKYTVFTGDKIHGIVPNESKHSLLIYGGYKMKLVPCSISNWGFNLNEIESRSVNVGDWILCATIMKNGHIGTVVMHNEVIIFNAKLECIKTVVCSKKCILYSAFLCEEQADELVVISGTVFGELIIWTSKNPKVLVELLGHKGAIFSIDYSTSSGPSGSWITSTSDDRAAILWSLKSKTLTEEMQKLKSEIRIEHKLFGHQSRVFLCRITAKCVITAGEDGHVNLWNFQGDLMRTLEPFPRATVRSLDVKNDICLWIGGANGAIVSYDLERIDFYRIQNSTLVEQNPIKVGLLRDGCVVVLGKDGSLYRGRYNTELFETIDQRRDSYNILQVSNCRRMFALCGHSGQVYIYKLIAQSDIILDQSLTIGSGSVAFHWLNCSTFLTLHNKSLHMWILPSTTAPSRTFTVPETTTDACRTAQGHIVTGDRRGNVNLYHLTQETPVQVLKKQVSYLGVTRIKFEVASDSVWCLGRNGTFLRYVIQNDRLQVMATYSAPFAWLGDLERSHLMGFHGKFYVLWDYRDRKKLFSVNCGGGHRSWDSLKQGQHSQFVYLKDKTVNYVINDDSASKTIVRPTHSDTINCIKHIESGDRQLILTASEDTALHVYSTVNFETFTLELVQTSHLSSVRCLAVRAISKGQFMIFSGGGRGQIIAWSLSDGITVSCNRQDEFIAENGPDTRIMDLQILHTDQLYLFAGCSDGNIMIFKIKSEKDWIEITPVKIIKRTIVCLLKLFCFQKKDFAVVMSTACDGHVTFWTAPTDDIENFSICQDFQIHQSGINTFYSRTLLNDRLLCLSGGDDNALTVTLYQFSKHNGRLAVAQLNRTTDVTSHCAQITGTFLTDDFFLSTSLDQKLLLFRWEMGETGTAITWKKVAEYRCSVADIQTMRCIELRNSFRVIVAGEGFQSITCRKS